MTPRMQEVRAPGVDHLPRLAGQHARKRDAPTNKREFPETVMRAQCEVALHQPDGRALGPESVAAITRHEVGHLLGLDHTRDRTSIMSAQVHVAELSEADRRTARLVYDLPPGKLPR